MEPDKVRVPAPVFVSANVFSFVPAPPSIPEKAVSTSLLSVSVTDVRTPLTTEFVPPPVADKTNGFYGIY